MEYTENELAALQGTTARLDTLRTFLVTRPVPKTDMAPQTWYTYLAEVKSILGNFSNDLSLVSCLMAKEYLSTQHTLVPFDAAEKPQGASGLDVDERTTSGDRVIVEIKTTIPYQKIRFGAAQTTALRKDFVKLQHHEAEHKYMFVTDLGAFDVLRRGFTDELQGVTIVCLTSGDEYRCARLGTNVGQRNALQ